MRAMRLPPAVEERCLRLAAAMRLPLAGIDLRRTPRGEWYCFEVNPSPAFTFYTSHTGQPVAEAIASLLMRAAPGWAQGTPVAGLALIRPRLGEVQDACGIG